ncbi:MAG TPA: hypothetical protein DDW30_06120, partial [Clostridiales bacterium]|nr:hypothetical protein [Clostridiales bacterium]
FTDTATTSVNTIQAGTLKVDIVNESGDSVLGTGLSFRNVDGTATGEAILWEPGCTYRTEGFMIKSTGKLALKYKVYLNGLDGNSELLKVITFSIVDASGNVVDLNAFEGHLTPNDTVSEVLYLQGTMATDAGNDYQGKELKGISITVVATQDTVEKDSKDEKYDENATLPIVASIADLNTNMTAASIPMAKNPDGTESATKHVPVIVPVGEKAAEDITYFEHNSGYTGKGVMFGSTNLNSYAAAPANAGDYTFIFRDGTVNSAATGYTSIDNLKDTSVYMLVPGNSDVVFENMTFNGVVSFDIQMYTSPWSYLNSITFKNCTFNGIVVGSCPAVKATFDGCTFKNYTNAAPDSANNSNPIWWRAATGYWGEGADESVHSLEEFTFINNKVTSTRPVKIERIGWNCTAKITILDNEFDISAQAGDTVTKNMAINIGQKDSTSKFILIDDGNTISANTASLYTAALTDGSNQYVVVSGSQVLDRNGKDKTITAMVWKTTTGETFEMKTIK